MSCMLAQETETAARKAERANAAEEAKALADKTKVLTANVEEYSTNASMVKKMFVGYCIVMGV